MSNDLKYIVTNQTKTISDHIVHRIVALKGFNDVEPGDFGGWIESPMNLSHEDTCWIYDEAAVYGNAHVYGNAKIKNEAEVRDAAVVNGHAKVLGKAMVYDNASISDYAVVSEQANVFGNARVRGSAHVTDHAVVSGNAIITGSASVIDNAKVVGACLSDYVLVDRDSEIDHDITIGGELEIVDIESTTLADGSPGIKIVVRAENKYSHE